MITAKLKQHSCCHPHRQAENPAPPRIRCQFFCKSTYMSDTLIDKENQECNASDICISYSSFIVTPRLHFYLNSIKIPAVNIHKNGYRMILMI